VAEVEEEELEVKEEEDEDEEEKVESYPDRIDLTGKWSNYYGTSSTSEISKTVSRSKKDNFKSSPQKRKKTESKKQRLCRLCFFSLLR
jgi:DNA-directed RNA polymerase alpha subunit